MSKSESVIIRAGAGAGKTTKMVSTIFDRFHEYKANNRNPRFVVCTFTRKATQELKERLLKKALEKNDDAFFSFVKSPFQLHISTIHGVLHLFLREHGQILGLSPSFDFLSDQEELQLYKKALKEAQDNPELKVHLQVLTEQFQIREVILALQSAAPYLLLGDGGFISRDKLANLRNKRMSSFLETAEELQTLVAASPSDKWRQWGNELSTWLQNFRSSGVFDELSFPRKNKDVSEDELEKMGEFKADLEEMQDREFVLSEGFLDLHERMATHFQALARAVLSRVLQLKIQDSKISTDDLETFALLILKKDEQVGRQFSESFDSWFVDEFQDTSPRQVRCIDLLSQNKPLFIVGDPQQSIYLFRGARFEVFAEKEKEFLERKHQLESLQVNYRSEKRLVHFFNEVFPKFQGSFVTMNSGSELAVETERPVQIYRSNSWEGEVHHVLNKLNLLLQQKVAPESIAVLSRDRATLFEIAKQAQLLSIPVEVNVASDYQDRQEVQEALALLKFILNPADNKNLMILLRSPFCRVEDEKLVEVADQAKRQGVSHWRILKQSSSVMMARLTELLGRVESEGVFWPWKEALIDFGYFDFCHLIDPTGKREANLWKLVTDLRAAERQPGFDYLNFILNFDDFHKVSVESQAGQEASSSALPNRVQFMTVHGSKGLQFDHVLIVNMSSAGNQVQREVPLWSQDESSRVWTLAIKDPASDKTNLSLWGYKIRDEQVERTKMESERLFYVAMTRARKSLSLFWSKKPQSGSWADSLVQRAGLSAEPGEHKMGETPYEVIYQDIERPTALSDVLVAPSILPPVFPQTVRAQSEKSVTELIQKDHGGSRERMAENLKKAARGTRIHGVLETWKYRQDLTLDVDEAKALDFIKNWNEGLLIDVIKSGEVEWGFSAFLNKKLVHGQIDLYGQDRSLTYWIVDYKTGDSSFSDKAFQQLRFYAWALRRVKKMADDQKIRLAAVYPFEEIVKVEESPSQEILEKEIRELMGL